MQRRSVLKYLGLAAGAQLGPARVLALTGSDQAVAGAVGPGIFINQVGYRPHDAKVATVRDIAAPENKFRLRPSAGDEVVFEGSLTPPQVDAASGDKVCQAVFSGLLRPGTYRLEVAGHSTDPFTIGSGVYRDALRSTMRGYYGQRCGCDVDLGQGYKHPACHLKGEYDPTSGKTGALPNKGGWHDAGDYGRYVVNSGITCGTLLWAWEMYPEAVQRLDLGIPKSQHGLPDYLEEILWNLNWMLELQDDDGGVFHKQTSTHFCGFIMPQDDTLPSEVIGTGAAPYKSTCATADLASVMAIAARCYRRYDKVLSDRFLGAARKAWTWAMQHPNVAFDNPPTISTGSYADPHCADELLWASAELWRTTGEPQYEQAFLKGLPPNLDDLTIDSPSWAGVGPMAYWTYVLAPAPGTAKVKAAIRKKTRAAAATLVGRAAINGYGNTMTGQDYIWGSNSVAANQSLLLAISDRFEANPDAVTAAFNNLHYILGRNCHGVSWVTQVGTRPFMHPHHRPSAADNIVAPWPGLMSGGPNRHPGDTVAKTLPPSPPMRMWIDDTMAYSMNEIAINWNAPLVFLLAFANTSPEAANSGSRMHS